MSYANDPALLVDLLRFREKLSWKTFVETGTEFGSSLKILHRYFEEIYSCENDNLKINYLKENGFLDELKSNRSPFNSNAVVKKLKIYTESSITALPKIFNEINHNNFFLYLDSHIDFVENNEYNPILDELDIVSNHGLKPFIIIHDFQHTNVQFRKGYSFNNGKIELGFDYVKNSMDKIFGINNWNWKLNDESYDLSGLDSKIGAGYFWEKSILI